MTYISIKVDEQGRGISDRRIGERWIAVDDIAGLADVERVTKIVGGTPVEFVDELEIRLRSRATPIYTTHHDAIDIISAMGLKTYDTCGTQIADGRTK